LETGKRIYANKWTEINIDINVISKVHQLADKEAQPWIHDEPFIVTYKDEPTKFRTVEVGIIDQDDNLEHSDNSIGSVESRPENEHQQNVQEIQELDDQTLRHIKDQSTEDEISDDGYLADDISSGTTIEVSDSTYIPEGSVVNEQVNISPSISTVDSLDFTFNIVNAYDSSDEILKDTTGSDIQVNVNVLLDDAATHNSMYESTESDEGIPSLDLMNLTTDSDNQPKGIQLFNVGEVYEKALHVMFTQMSAQKGIKMFGGKQ